MSEQWDVCKEDFDGLDITIDDFNNLSSIQKNIFANEVKADRRKARERYLNALDIVRCKALERIGNHIGDAILCERGLLPPMPTTLKIKEMINRLDEIITKEG